VNLTLADVVRAFALFGAAAAAEIGGGWLVWQWLRVDRPWPVGLLGAALLVGYGVIVTFQTEANFGRVYAAYGGVFIAGSLAWAAVADGFRPDGWDYAGAALALAGAAVMLFAPRS
jgi:small multidrug resistance family-3 protein